MQSISIIVPAYNEEQRIASYLRQLEAEVSPHVSSFEIIVVSDGSIDGTADAARAVASPNIRVFHYEQNVGKGNAIRHGCAQATGDLVLFVDGGAELRPHDIRIFLGLLELYDADAVIGSKRHPQSRVDYPLHRRFLSRVFQKIVRWSLGLNIRDTQVGLKLFRKEVLDVVLPLLLVKRYAFDVELLAVAHHRGFRKIIEAPIVMDWRATHAYHHHPREYAHTFRVGWNLILDVAAIVYRVRWMKYYDTPMTSSVVSSRAERSPRSGINSVEGSPERSIGDFSAPLTPGSLRSK